MQELQRRLTQIPLIISETRAQLIGKATARGTVKRLAAFSYSTTLTVTAGALVFKTFTDIHADSDFLWLYIVGGMITSAPGLGQDIVINPEGARVLFRDTTTGRALESAGVYTSLTAGFGGRPYIMQESRLIFAKSKIETRMTSVLNAGTDSTNTYQFGFVGLKVFYEGGA